MKILVTGGAGFIGNQVVQMLQTKHSVTVYDNFTTYHTGPVHHLHRLHDERVRHLAAAVIRSDIRDRSMVTQLIDSLLPECVIHLASYPRANLVNANPKEAFEVMISSLVGLLDACARYGVRRFVFISSSMVYGDFGSDQILEDAPCNPIGKYGRYKLMGEQLVKEFCEIHDIEYVIIRPSAVYGVLDSEDRVIAKFIFSALQGMPLNVKGAGEMLDFTYVTDIAKGIVLAATVDKAKNNTYNVTYGRSHSLLEAAELICKVTKSDSVIEILERDESFPTRGSLSIQRAKDDLGYSPKIPLSKGIPLYYDWYVNSILTAR